MAKRGQVKVAATAKVPDNRAAILKVYKRTFQLTVEERDNKPAVGMLISPATRGMSLSHLTLDELHALRDLFNMAFELAEPVCRQLDREARENYEAGGEDFDRLYRAAPVLVVRERAFVDAADVRPEGSPTADDLVARAQSRFCQYVRRPRAEAG